MCSAQSQLQSSPAIANVEELNNGAVGLLRQWHGGHESIDGRDSGAQGSLIFQTCADGNLAAAATQAADAAATAHGFAAAGHCSAPGPGSGAESGNSEDPRYARRDERCCCYLRDGGCRN